MSDVTGMCWRWFALSAAAIAALGCVEQAGPVLGDTPRVPAPDPVLPLPTADQLAWQAQELSVLFHFGINTSADKEQGDGTDSPTLFNPTALDASAWMEPLQGADSAGFRQAMLTAKHHDGFCLWPTKCSTSSPAYSVAASPWLMGRGDVVRDFVDAAHRANIRVGLAISPLDKHEPTYGTAAYAAVFECQLTELLTNYGDVDEVWFWADSPLTPALNWKSLHDLVHRLQPHALVDVGNAVASQGADVRSVGDALAPRPVTDQASVQTSPDAAPDAATASSVWYPAEAVYSIRPSWFWHAADDTRLKTLPQLIDYYYDSVGRNSLLRLNVPPNAQGLLATPDVLELGQYRDAIRAIYQSNVAAARPAVSDSVFHDMPSYGPAMAVDGKPETFWAAGEGTTSARLEIDLGSPRSFNVVSLQEPIALGERVTQHHVEAKSNGVWTTIASGTAIGHRKLHRVGPLTATNVALVITQARAAPAITELGVYSPSP